VSAQAQPQVSASGVNKGQLVPSGRDPLSDVQASQLVPRADHRGRINAATVFAPHCLDHPTDGVGPQLAPYPVDSSYPLTNSDLDEAENVKTLAKRWMRRVGEPVGPRHMYWQQLWTYRQPF
jgi:hypothetical protein